MSRSSAAQRPLTFLLTALLAAVALMLSSLSFLPSASATVEDAAQTAGPEAGAPADDAAVTEEPGVPAQPEPVQPDVQVAAVPPVEDFVVDYMGPECWDSSYNVAIGYDGDATDLRVALQEDVDGEWITLMTERFYDGYAFLAGDQLDEGVTSTFRVVVYDRAAVSEQTVVHGPLEVTGVSTEDCGEWEMPALPEEQWTVAETTCGAVTFTSRADEEVVVLWFGEDTEEIVPGEGYFFLAPGEARTVETTEQFIYWVSAVGVGEDLEPIDEEVLLAGEGEVEVSQDCAPTEPTEPAQPTQPVDPSQPAEPAQPQLPAGDHKVPGKVQTDGGASLATVATGLLMVLGAALGLVRRAA